MANKLLRRKNNIGIMGGEKIIVIGTIRRPNKYRWYNVASYRVLDNDLNIVRSGTIPLGKLNKSTKWTDQYVFISGGKYHFVKPDNKDTC